MEIKLRALTGHDAQIISNAFAKIGWNKPVSQYEQYLNEQNNDSRIVRVATVNHEFAGYLTVLKKSLYHPFHEQQIPEIQDLNVLPSFRNKGVATKLLDEAEQIIRSFSPIAGIGVGLHPGYNEAQKLYSKRGYVPNGLGVTYKYEAVKEGEKVVLDDDLVLWMTKNLRINYI